MAVRTIENFSLENPLFLTEISPKVQLILTPEGKSYAWQVFSLDNNSWLLHAGGNIAVETKTIDAILQAKCEALCARD